MADCFLCQHVSRWLLFRADFGKSWGTHFPKWGRQPTNKENMQDQLTIDITILHVARSNRIKVHFPERTRRLWRALTAKTRYYLATAEVQDCILEENPRVLGEWTRAQAVLERLSYMSGPHQLSLDEATNILNLIIGATLYWFRNGDRWEHTEAMLLTAAQVARFELEPLKAVNDAGRKKKGRALECYESIRTKIGVKSGWFSVHDIYCWWLELRRCRSQNSDVLGLQRKLDVACKPFRLVFEKF